MNTMPEKQEKILNNTLIWKFNPSMIVQNMNSIEKFIVERALHDQENHNRLKKLNDRKLQIQECKIQEVKAADASSGTVNDQSPEKQSSTSSNESSRSRNKCSEKSNSGDDTDVRPSYDREPMVDSNTTPDSSYMCNNEFRNDQYADDHENERVVLDNLIANLKLDIDENKKIQKQLKKANATLTHEMNECKSALEKSNDIRDRCISALHHKEVELEKYKTYKNCHLEKEEIE
ncbi:hypothetical protein Tco_1254418, partial [Tanacetum coccineum]